MLQENLYKRQIDQVGDIDLRQIWKKQDQKFQESFKLLVKFRAIFKKFVEIITFIEEFIAEYAVDLELQENNFYQIAILLGVIRFFIKLYLVGCSN